MSDLKERIEELRDAVELHESGPAGAAQAARILPRRILETWEALAAVAAPVDLDAEDPAVLREVLTYVRNSEAAIVAKLKALEEKPTA